MVAKKDFEKVGNEMKDTIGEIVSNSQGQKDVKEVKEKKDQRLTLAIRKTAMTDLKNLANLKQTTLNSYVNELIEADVEKNRATLDAFKEFANKVE